MNMKFLATSAVAAVMLAAPAFAATFTLDTFDEVQAVSADPFEESTIAGRGTTGIAADTRYLSVDNTVAVGVNPIGATELGTFGGVLTFSNKGGARGTAVVEYAGLDLMNTFDKGFFLFDGIEPNGFDGIAQFTAEAFDGTTTIKYEEALGASFSPILRFNQFEGKGVTDVASAFNFSNVGYLRFTFDTTNTAKSIDGQLASIEVSAVPVPAAGLLLLGAMGGLAGLRRRKAKKAA